MGICVNTFAFDFPLLGPGSRLWAVRFLPLDAATSCACMAHPGGTGPARASYIRIANAITAADRNLVQDINPELLLATFLPVLLFAGAFNLEWHLVRRLKWSGLLLAGAHLLHARRPRPALTTTISISFYKFVKPMQVRRSCTGLMIA